MQNSAEWVVLIWLHMLTELHGMCMPHTLQTTMHLFLHHVHRLYVIAVLHGPTLCQDQEFSPNNVCGTGLAWVGLPTTFCFASEHTPLQLVQHAKVSGHMVYNMRGAAVAGISASAVAGILG